MTKQPNLDPGAASPVPLKPARRSRDSEKTRQGLLLAFQRIQSSGEKMNISTVANEAGVTPSLLHNTYPDIAEKIRAHRGRGTREQRDRKAVDLLEARKTIRDLRKKAKNLEADIAKLASLNLNLESEVSVWKAAAAGKVVILGQGK